MVLLQWFDSRQGLACASQCPSVQQLFPVKGTPFMNVRKRALREVAVNLPSCYIDSHLMFAILAPSACRRNGSAATGASGLMNMNWVARR